MKNMAASQALLVTSAPTTVEEFWGRPRRQTDPYHCSTTRPSTTGKEASEARRSLDSAIQRQPRPRPWTRDSSSAISATPQSPLSAERLSNPALAEIPSRKYRSSQCLSEGVSPATVLSPSRTLAPPTATFGYFAEETVTKSNEASNNTAVIRQNEIRADATDAVNITGLPSLAACRCHLTHEVHNMNHVPTTASRHEPSASLTTSSSTDITPSTKSISNQSDFVSNPASPRTVHTAPRKPSPHLSSPPLKHTTSRSSLGLEASTVHAPALRTRRTVIQERDLVLDNDRNAIPKKPSKPSIRNGPIKSIRSSPSLDKTLTTFKKRRVSPTKLPNSATTTAPNGRMSSTTMYTVAGGFDFGLDGDRTITSTDRLARDDNSTEETKSRNSDVFLNFAKANGDPIDDGEKRRRFRLSGFTSRRTSQFKDATPSPEQHKFSSHQPSPLTVHDVSSPSLRHNPTTLISPTTTVHPLDESNRLRYPLSAATPRSISGLGRSRLGASSRDASPDSHKVPAETRLPNSDTRTYRPSTLSGSRTSRHGSFSDAVERPRFDTDRVRHDGTESTLSTTAPSTVWDELDDLKARIRNLELTGKFPSSSALSNVSGERPRTANTAMTNFSSSPKHIKKTSAPSPDSGMNGSPAPNQVQRLLNSALAKAKGAVTPGVYAVLEMASTDAVALSSHLGSPPPAGSSSASVANGTNMSDRQAKRKADSLCRSLTELCLVLTEECPKAATTQPLSVEVCETASPLANNTTINGDDPRLSRTRYRRSMSHEPEPREATDSTSMTPSRLESIRSSTVALSGGGGGQRMPQEDRPVPRNPAANFSTPLARLSRVSNSLHIARQSGEGSFDDRSSVYTSSQPSRAMTEVGGLTIRQRPTTRTRLSGDFSQSPSEPSYTRKSLGQSPSLQPPPQPDLPTHSASVTQSGLPVRRSYPTAAVSGIPATSSANFQPGSRRYAASGLNTSSPPARRMSESPEETYESPQGYSQTRISVPSSKLATSHTIIPQPRTRTSSFGTRRLLSRPRLSSSVDSNQIGSSQK